MNAPADIEKSKVGRRKFLGLFAASAAVAPAAAQKAAETLGHGTLNQQILGHGMGVPIAGGNHVDKSFLRREMADIRQNLKDLASGKETHVDPQIKALKESVRLDAMRSISPVNRVRMVTEIRDTEQRRAQEHYMKKRLSDLLKQWTGWDA